jgi:hypothetical protein
MLAMDIRWSIDSPATPSPANSTAWLSTSSRLNTPHRAMMMSLPTTPGASRFRSTTRAIGGACHHVTPVAQIDAASVRTTGVPSAAIAPYRFECESEPTTIEPGTTYPCSTITWWLMPVPAG